MTSKLALVDPPSAAEQSPARRLADHLDHDFLREIGWDPDLLQFRLPPDHPIVGWTKCRHPQCKSAAATQSAPGLCPACDKRRLARKDTIDDYLAIDLSALRVWARGEYSRCRVHGCERPVREADLELCVAHATRIKLHVNPRPTPEQIQAFSATAQPYQGWGQCRATACLSTAGTPAGLCFIHQYRWKNHLQDHPGADMADWCATNPGIRVSGVINLRGLTELVRLQLLVAVQRRLRGGNARKLHAVDRLVDFLRANRTQDLLDVADGPNDALSTLLRGLQDQLRVALLDPATEQQKDNWDLRVFGMHGRIDFSVVSQHWLRQITKAWLLDEIPGRYGAAVESPLRDHVNSVAELSRSLRETRADHGTQTGALSRDDIVTFLNRLAHQQRRGQLTVGRRARVIRNTRTVLRHARDTGLARPGQSLEQLAAEVSIRADDIPAVPTHTAEGRALPEELFPQLIAALPDLERRSGTAVRTAVELLMDTGRRPDEICQLPIDCLDVGADGKTVLVYTDYKHNSLGRRLPITDGTAQLIRDQQTRVRQQYPDAPAKRLVLLPAANRNILGDRPIRATTLTNFHHDWIHAQPDFTFLDGTVFPKHRIVPYAYRHSYAQRHADAGTPVDVLRDLMGHRHYASTQTYYRITEKRTRAAVDTLAAHQIDGAGRRIWSQIDGLLDSERARQRIGEVAVPFGNCTEPSNVRAGGGACPYRFRCTGCGHFRTDASYLPELRSYLDQLLDNRERVAATTDLEDWARAEAAPSDTEINRVRDLIHQLERDLDNLTPADRADILDAVKVVRTTRRSVHLGIPATPTPAGRP